MHVLALTSALGCGSHTTVPAPSLPGAPPLPDAVLDAMEARSMPTEASAHPTRHTAPDGTPLFTNRLVLERSPYLQQHAHNPVDWYPLGRRGLRRSPPPQPAGAAEHRVLHVPLVPRHGRRELRRSGDRRLPERPLHLHQVDREERPDIDAVYMAAVQALTGRGGWPMTVWLTPDRLPFYGGTYFPARTGDRGGGRPGFKELSQSIAERYATGADGAAEAAASLSKEVARRLTLGPSGAVPGQPALDAAMASVLAGHDPVRGGMRRAPKFPSTTPLRLMLRQHWRAGDPALLEAASLTLDQMARGGIHDALGGGFHRYSTDVDWRVPHFEKMLYNLTKITRARSIQAFSPNR